MNFLRASWRASAATRQYADAREILRAIKLPRKPERFHASSRLRARHRRARGECGAVLAERRDGDSTFAAAADARVRTPMLVSGTNRRNGRTDRLPAAMFATLAEFAKFAMLAKFVMFARLAGSRCSLRSRSLRASPRRHQLRS